MIFHDEEGVHMSEADYAELVKREIGPCGKHLKMFWVEGCDGDCINPGCKGTEAYCSLCREIEQAVAGAYEAAAQATCISCEKGIPVSYDSKRKLWTHSGGLPRCDASLIRALDSSAARRGKQRIRQAPLTGVLNLIDSYIGDNLPVRPKPLLRELRKGVSDLLGHPSPEEGCDVPAD